MSTASRPAGGYKVIHTAGKIAQQDVVLDKAHSVFLIYEAGGRIACISAVGKRTLLASVAACDIDITFSRVSRGGCLVGLCRVSRSACIDDHWSRCCCIHLTVGAGHGSLIINDKGSCCSPLGHIGCPVAVCINAFHISAGHTYRYSLIIRQLRIGHCRYARHCPCIRAFGISPFRFDIGQIKRLLNICLLRAVRSDDHGVR